MSQLLDYTKRQKKSTKKGYQKVDKKSKINPKIIFGSELSETNNDVRLHKKSRKNRKIIFGSELSKTNNEPTLKIEKLFLDQNCLKRIMSQLLDVNFILTTLLYRLKTELTPKIFPCQLLYRKLFRQLIKNSSFHFVAETIFKIIIYQ